MRTPVDLSYHQDWSPFILTLELHPIRPNEDHCGPVLPLGQVSLHPYIGPPTNKAQRGPLWENVCPPLLWKNVCPPTTCVWEMSVPLGQTKRNTLTDWLTHEVLYKYIDWAWTYSFNTWCCLISLGNTWLHFVSLGKLSNTWYHLVILSYTW